MNKTHKFSSAVIFLRDNHVFGNNRSSRDLAIATLQVGVKCFKLFRRKKCKVRQVSPFCG